MYIYMYIYIYMYVYIFVYIYICMVIFCHHFLPFWRGLSSWLVKFHLCSNAKCRTLPLSQTRISKRVFMNEISSSALLDIQLTLLCVCGVDSFLPKLEHCTFSRSLFQKEGFEIWGCSFVSELKLKSTSSAEKNFADEITWITWKTKQNLEIWPFLNSHHTALFSDTGIPPLYITQNLQLAQLRFRHTPPQPPSFSISSSAYGSHCYKQCLSIRLKTACRML